MPLPVDKAGKLFPAVSYAVGREKIREYADAVGETHPLHHSLEAARAAGYEDLVAPPMFAVVYAGRAVRPALFDPELELDFSMMVHGSQEFHWEQLVVAGDEIDTEVEVKSITEKRGLGFYVFESRSRNQRDEPVCVGTWTNIVRGLPE
jgi:acyl dehydratase